MHACILLAGIIAVAGCAPVAPQLDSRFGDSVRTLMSQQALPSQPRGGNDGFDAAAAHNALSQYRQSFKAPARTPRQSIGVAGGSSAGD